MSQRQSLPTFPNQEPSSSTVLQARTQDWGIESQMVKSSPKQWAAEPQAAGSSQHPHGLEEAGTSESLPRMKEGWEGRHG